MPLPMVTGTPGPPRGAAPAAHHRPTFLLTFDTELIWGSFDHTPIEVFRRRYPDVRGVIGRVLGLLERYEIPATWAMVGHLFLSECARSPEGLAHAGLVRPAQRWHPGDWYARDPCTDRARDPLWYGDDIIDRLLASAVPQEIGCHSFGHVLFDDPDLTRAAVESDLRACVDVAARRGLTLRSFVFPRNREGHHEVLRDLGFLAYRGADPTRLSARLGQVARASRLLVQASGMAPPISGPVERLPGLWNIPGSTLLLDHRGPRRLVSRAARVRRLAAGVRCAVQEGGTFHLWTHPFNLASSPELLLGVLDDVLRQAADARDRGHLQIATMGGLAAQLSDSDHGGVAAAGTEAP